MKIHLDPDPAGNPPSGNPPPAPPSNSPPPPPSNNPPHSEPWYKGFPAEYEGLVKSKNWDSPLKALESYRNLEKHLGVPSDRLLKLPLPTDGKEAWEPIYKALGKPESPDKYQIPELKLGEGITIDTAKLDAVKKVMHETGITQKQAESLIKWYGSDLTQQVEAYKNQQTAAKQAGEAELKKAWGDKFEPELDTARAVIRKFGNEELLAELEQSGMGNHPKLTQFLNKVGKAMLEDSATGANKNSAFYNDASIASNKIAELRLDKQFIATLFDPNATGHKEAKAKWTELHRLASKPVA